MGAAGIQPKPLCLCLPACHADSIGPCRNAQLPEIFNHPYGNDHFPKYAETLPSVGDETPINKELSPSAATLQAAAKYNGVVRCHDLHGPSPTISPAALPAG